MRIEDYMREWLLDCFCDPYDVDEVNDCTDSELAAAIELHWDGGLVDFAICHYTRSMAVQGLFV